jgi:hypothetical protein
MTNRALFGVAWLPGNQSTKTSVKRKRFYSPPQDHPTDKLTIKQATQRATGKSERATNN